MLILTTQETSTNTGLQWDMFYIVPSTGELALYFSVYYRIVYYRG